MTSVQRIAIAAIAGVLGVAATSALGFWQLRRAAAKEVLQHDIDAAAIAEAIEPGAKSLLQPDALVHRHLRFVGRWVPDRVVYLDNRPQGGRAGFYVLMPLRIERPIAADVIVNRGWIPRDLNDRTRIGRYGTPGGTVEITGVALADEPRLLDLAKPAEWPLPGIWQNFDHDAFGRASGREPLGIVLRQDREAPGAGPSLPTDGLSRDWPDRAGTLQAQIDRHHGYAFQWFALAATLLALLAYQVLRVIRHGRPVPN